MPQLEKSKIPFLFVSSQLAGTDSSPYSITKYAAEQYCRNISNATIARQWNAYGSIETQDIRSHVVSDLITQAVNNNEIKLRTSGLEQRQFVHMGKDFIFRLRQHRLHPQLVQQLQLALLQLRFHLLRLVVMVVHQ